MKITLKSLRLPLPKTIACLALGAALLTGISSPARADWHHDRDWDHHEAYVHHDRWHGHPEHVYAPPVVYAPPPESSGINLILPLHFH